MKIVRQAQTTVPRMVRFSTLALAALNFPARSPAGLSALCCLASSGHRNGASESGKPFALASSASSAPAVASSAVRALDDFNDASMTSMGCNNEKP